MDAGRTVSRDTALKAGFSSCCRTTPCRLAPEGGERLPELAPGANGRNDDIVSRPLLSIFKTRGPAWRGMTPTWISIAVRYFVIDLLLIYCEMFSIYR